MKRHFLLLSAAVVLCAHSMKAAEPLRVFIRGGVKTHGPNAHEHERFLNDWKVLLTQRGIKTDGAKDWPTAAQIKDVDVIVAYAEEAGDATSEQQKLIEEFTKRGGGLVVIHSASVAMKNSAWWKSIIGGSWVNGKTKWKEGPMDLYYVENERLDSQHPITKGASNFHLDDEIYYDMDISPDVRVLATSYTPNVPAGKKVAPGGKVNIYDIQPQMWVYEKEKSRAFVSIPGHLYGTFEKPNYRAILLRGIAWVGKRENVDEFCKKEEIDALLYPEGGPQRPADTLKALEIHPDFTLKLVASEPLINKPMNFDWDPAGRMWVAETPEYPNGRRGMRPDYRGKEWKDHGGLVPQPGVQDRPAHDKISILTDTDGDGVMDRKDIFYEGLDLVTGFVFHKDGVIVTQAPDILWLRDTNGDGKADKVEKLYTGLGTQDTHAVINNPRWGWDGWIYCTHGYSASRDVTSGDGTKHFGPINSGVVRFKPDGSAFEQYSSKGGNTWGLEITGDNRVMWTQPTSGQLLMHTVLPEYALARGKVGNLPSYKVVEPSGKAFPLMSWEQMAYVQIDLVGSFTAAAGCVIYDGGAWPAEYNGDYFCTEPTINVVHHTRLTPEGSSYTFHKLPGREQTEFIRSKDMWWRPIEVRVAPDGAVYIGDFYNQAVIHNDTRGPDHNRVNASVRPDRDHYFGRIWRLDHKQAKKLVVPDLSKADAQKLVTALEHPSRAVRMTASRLLSELNPAPGDKPVPGSPVGKEQFGIADMIKLAGDGSKSAEARIAALWTLNNKRSTEPGLLPKLMEDGNAEVRRNAALVAESLDRAGKGLDSVGIAATNAALSKLLADPDPHVRVAALRALASSELSDVAAKALVTAWPKFDDDFQRSAAIGAAAANPAASIGAALDAANPGSLAPLVQQLTQRLADQGDTSAAAKLVISLASKPANADALKRSILETLGKSLKTTPVMTPELSAALGKLLASGASGSALPIAAKWDKAGALKPQVTQLTTGLLAKLNDTTAADDVRLAAGQNLLGLRSINPEALPAVIKTVTSNTSPDLKRQLITALGETADARVGTALAAAFPQLPPEAQSPAFEVLLQRAEWSLALLEAMKSKQVDVTTLGPSNLARLRTHPDKTVSQRANGVLDELLGPTLKAKNEAIAKLTPIVEQAGDAGKGKALFTATCATCHKLDELGADIGPLLTGMGAHGPAELLVAIVDPNREVDPSYTAWNIETKNGQLHSGILARENPASITLKSLAGVEEIKQSDIKSRVNTGRSLMPEGFEALGGEALRDLLTFICGSEAQHFRLVDLSSAFTADTRGGLYNSRDIKAETLPLRKFGIQSVEGIPFNIVDPTKSRTGNNVIVLKGGPGRSFSRTLPQRVEASLGGFKANRLHFLGAVTGWGYGGSDGDTSKVMKATVVYADGQTEELVFSNGAEFADYIGVIDVPGSKLAPGLLAEHQLRWFSKRLERAAPINKLVLESFDTSAAPTIVAVTAENADINATGPGQTTERSQKTATVPTRSEPKALPPASSGPGMQTVRITAVGGGSSHDFKRWFGDADTATLLQAKPRSINYTEKPDALIDLADSDVVYLSLNQAMPPAAQQGIMKFAAAGKGLLLVHPALWYNWADFPEYNRELVGGGAKSHDKYGEFEVEVLDPTHPLMAGLPAKFKISDELYHFVPDPSGTPIKILAQATSPPTGKTFPQVWVTQHPKARIVCITLGHDGKAHELPEFQMLLKNAVRWAAGK
jgi:putative membrane-bound dehydrogenase-like protein